MILALRMTVRRQCNRLVLAPETALDASKFLVCHLYSPFAHIYFSSLAYVEMRIILARMVFNFDMELDQPEQNWMDQECFVLWNKPKLMVKLKPRAHSQC
jgi:hypothetical protein